MAVLFPSWSLLAAFTVAAFVLAVTPGPGVFYIVTRSLAQGRRSGLASVVGVALGNLGNAVAAAAGLGALFAFSSAAFSIVKFAGAAYLIYLGVQTLCRQPTGLSPNVRRVTQPWRVFRDGVVVALLNPKTTLFFAAFLPQFMSPSPAPMLQSIALGALFVVIAVITDSVYAVGAGAFAPYLRRVRRVRVAGCIVSGGAFIGLGVFAALGETRSVK